MSRSIIEIARHPARFGALAAIAIAVAMLALFTAGTDTQAVHNEGLLELDGNTPLDAGGLGANPGSGNCPFVFENGAPVDCISTPATYDWNNVCTNTAGTNFIKKNSSFTGESSCTQDFAILSATGDNTYHTGSDKDYQDISSTPPGSPDVWHCSDIANATNKADLLNAYAVVDSKTEGGLAHQILYFGAERASENGTVFNGFWFLQDTASVPNDCPGSTNFTGKHTCGDVLILFNYDNGGRIGKIGAWNWQPGLNGCDNAPGGTGLNADCPNKTAADTHDPLCLIRVAGSGDCRAENPQGLLGDLCGRVNGASNCVITPPHERTPTLDQDPPPCSGPGPINTPWAPGCASGTNCSGALASPTFSEGGVDLTGLGVPIPCISTMIAETRSSDSVTATLKDFAIGAFGVTCESTISTTVHNASHQEPTKISGVPTAYAGQAVHDYGQLVISGPPNVIATGTVTFTLYNNNTCDAGTNNANVIGTPTVFNVSAAGGSTVTYDNVLPYTTVAGTNVSYQAVYSGDSHFAQQTSACEPLNVINPGTKLDKSLSFSTTVTYTYAETNDGDVPLTPPTPNDRTSLVTDPDCATKTFTGGDTSTAGGATANNGILDPGETWTFTCGRTITTTGTFSNTATGHGTEPLGRDVTFCTVAPVGTNTPTPTPPAGPNDGQFCDQDERDSTSITITVDQGKTDP